ncbi:ribosomal protein PSRP-3/Ycf65 [Artemisia annua]|uniref:Ribosomal protein PSRP-3/Ycf65 n=1 Tax=Artemisia annua TaxID=35608 RepID=A0A2U1N0K3_ARTAN|nr:ribosomal protein PSRP-3/Ycf65 [Artemisia annua]
MLSMSIHQGIKPLCPQSTNAVGTLKTISLHPSSLNFCNKQTHAKRLHKLSVAADLNEAVVAETAPPTLPDDKEDEAKKIQKPRLVLKFIWMEKNIGLGLDQVIPGHGTVPLSPYFFWPRKDAWEELKTTLESKPWISQKKMIILLNQATDIINLWQQSGGNLTS